MKDGQGFSSANATGTAGGRGSDDSSYRDSEATLKTEIRLKKLANAQNEKTSKMLKRFGEAVDVVHFKLVFYEDGVYATVNPKVLKMLDSLEIDPLGVSTDSLMLILPERHREEVMRALEGITRVYEVGRVESGSGVEMLGEERYPLEPLFRESPYTKIKKVVGSGRPTDMEEMKEGIEEASRKAVEKKDEIVRFVRNRNV